MDKIMHQTTAARRALVGLGSGAQYSLIQLLILFQT